MNDGSTDLAALRASGAKLILWHGWADPLISALHTVGYYKKLAQSFAPGADDAAAINKLSDFARLFMAPGVLHCGGGPGPSSFDAMGALEQWVEHGVAPDRLIATHLTAGKADRTRPLCPYPKKAVYDGKGNSDDAASFSCQ
jgi:feruloyl esterase